MCSQTNESCITKLKKGKQCVSSVTNGERGQPTTIVVVYTGSKTYRPPMMIFKGKSNKPGVG